MSDLDPAAVEAVAKALAESKILSAAPLLNHQVPWTYMLDGEKEHCTSLAVAAIRAIDTYRAAAVREAVIEVSDAACEAGRKVGCDLVAVWKRYADAKAALLALVNAEETE